MHKMRFVHIFNEHYNVIMVCFKHTMKKNVFMFVIIKFSVTICTLIKVFIGKHPTDVKGLRSIYMYICYNIEQKLTILHM